MPHRTSATGPSANHHDLSTPTADDVDVMKIDAANLQDVMQYTGFDLRSEAESMHQHIYQMPSQAAARVVEEDIRSLPQYCFNPMRLKSILSFYCRQHNVAEVDERVIEILGLALQHRLKDTLQLLVKISRHRVDYGRRLYKIKIENDPKKQFWLLERLRTNPPWSKEGDGGDEGDREHAAAKKDLADKDSLHSQHPLLSNKEPKKQPPSQQQQQQQQQQSAKSAPKKEEQSSIKSKMTNVTAMAAAGMKQRSWMSTGSATPSSLTDNYNPDRTTDLGTDASDAKPSPKTHPINLANAPSSIPLTDQELASQFRGRTITRHDLLSACEHDLKLRRSRLHIQLLDLAPLTLE